MRADPREVLRAAAYRARPEGHSGVAGVSSFQQGRDPTPTPHPGCLHAARRPRSPRGREAPVSRSLSSAGAGAASSPGSAAGVALTERGHGAGLEEQAVPAASRLQQDAALPRGVQPPEQPQPFAQRHGRRGASGPRARSPPRLPALPQVPGVSLCAGSRPRAGSSPASSPARPPAPFPPPPSPRRPGAGEGARPPAGSGSPPSPGRGAALPPTARQLRPRGPLAGLSRAGARPPCRGRRPRGGFRTFLGAREDAGCPGEPESRAPRPPVGSRGLALGGPACARPGPVTSGASRPCGQSGSELTPRRGLGSAGECEAFNKCGLLLVFYTRRYCGSLPHQAELEEIKGVLSRN